MVSRLRFANGKCPLLTGEKQVFLYTGILHAGGCLATAACAWPLLHYYDHSYIGLAAAGVGTIVCATLLKSFFANQSRFVYQISLLRDGKHIEVTATHYFGLGSTRLIPIKSILNPTHFDWALQKMQLSGQYILVLQDHTFYIVGSTSTVPDTALFRTVCKGEEIDTSQAEDVIEAE